MEELLYGLTPAEFWVYNYLQLLAIKQGGCPATIPAPGEDRELERVYTRKHFKNLLKSLKAKSRLTKLVIPKSKNKRIEVYLTIRTDLKYWGKNLTPISGNGLLDFPKKGHGGKKVTPIETLGKCSSPNEPRKMGTLSDIPPSPSLSFNSFKNLVELKQGDLKGEILSLDEGEIRKLIYFGEASCKYRPKSQKLSPQARLFALIRFLQEAESISKPQAWVDTVARRAEKDFAAVGSGRNNGSAARPKEQMGVRKW